MRRRFRGQAVTLRYLMHIPRPSGEVHTYVRIKGQPLVRMPDLPHDHPRFLAAYAAAVGQAPERMPPREGTIAALVVIAKASDAFAGLSGGYQRTLRRNLDAIAEAGMRAGYAGLQEHHVRADCEDAPSPHDRLKAWRFLCRIGLDRRRLRNDPSVGVRLPERKVEGHEPWTLDDLDAFRDRWALDTVPRRVMEVLRFSALRIADGCRIGPGMVDREGVLPVRQGKTRDLAYIPWSCALPPHAEHLTPDRDMMKAALVHAPRGLTFLCVPGGGMRSPKAVGGLIREAARAAKVEKSAHGLRKALAVSLAEAGATTHQIASWTGHATLKEVDRYTKAAERRRAVMGRNGNGTQQPAPREVQPASKR